MTKIISCFNNKGGVSKTTLNLNFALWLSKEDDKKILLIDMDAQSNLTSRLYCTNGESLTLGDAILNNLPIQEVIIKKMLENYPNLDFIPSNRNLRYLERVLINREEKELTILKYISQNKDYLSNYDYIIFDLSPNIGVVGMGTLLTCTDLILVNEYGNNDSLEMLNNFLIEYKEDSESLGLDMPNFAILTNYHNNKKTSSNKTYEEFESYFESLHPYMLENKLSESTVVKNTNIYKLSIADYTRAVKCNPQAMEQMQKIINELKERGVL